MVQRCSMILTVCLLHRCWPHFWSQALLKGTLQVYVWFTMNNSWKGMRLNKRIQMGTNTWASSILGTSLVIWGLHKVTGSAYFRLAIASRTSLQANSAIPALCFWAHFQAKSLLFVHRNFVCISLKTDFWSCLEAIWVECLSWRQRKESLSCRTGHGFLW